jgi:hypothetical protein
MLRVEPCRLKPQVRSFKRVSSELQANSVLIARLLLDKELLELEELLVPKFYS